MINGFLIGVAALAAIGSAAVQPERSAPGAIEWTISPRSNGAGTVQLDMRYRDRGNSGFSQNSGPARLADLQGLDPAALASAEPAPVRFRIQRDAGTIACDGVARSGRGTGACTFAPDERFAAELERRGIGRPSGREQFTLALHPAGLAELDELQRQGYRRPTVEELVAMGIHSVGLDYLRGLDSAGYRVGRVDRLVAMRIHGVTPAYVAEIASAGPGFRNLSADDLVGMRIHGVTPDFVRGMAAAGYPNLDRDQLLAMRIHGVTPAFVREMAAAGYTGLTAQQLVSLRIHGVTPDYARRANAVAAAE